MNDIDPHSAPKPPEWPLTDDAIRDVFESMLRDGSWGRYHGPHCDQLRSALAEFHDVEHVVLCCSGTSAVELALRAAKVQPGDEVILAAYDYKANFANVVALGAIPVLVDTLPGLPALDPAQLNDAISAQTRAVICSHLHGCFAPVSRIKTAIAQQDLILIEDACQASGAILEGKSAGSMADMGVLSFGGSKLLTAGRGGAILTNDATLAQRIRLYTQRGNDAYPLSEMQAAVLMPQLHQLSERTQTRLRNVEQLLSHLSASPCLHPALPPNPFHNAHNIPAFYKLAFRYQPRQNNHMPRDEFAATMRERGVALDPAFPALHRIHSQRRFRAVGELSNANSLHHYLLTLHHPVLLGRREEIQTVAALLNGE